MLVSEEELLEDDACVGSEQFNVDRGPSSSSGAHWAAGQATEAEEPLEPDAFVHMEDSPGPGQSQAGTARVLPAAPSIVGSFAPPLLGLSKKSKSGKRVGNRVARAVQQRLNTALFAEGKRLRPPRPRVTQAALNSTR